MTPLSWSLLGLSCFSLLLYSLVIATTLKHMRRRRLPKRHAIDLPPLSVIKPLKGEEESLRDNLLSLFTQEYPSKLEIIFASTERHDPALHVARQVAACFPAIESKFVWADEAFALNPKVANVAAALQVASHDLLFQSDANVRLTPGYLRQIVGEYEDSGASLLSSLVVGVGESSYGAAMENLHLSASIAPAMCAALHIAGVPCVIGKALLMRRSELIELGGLHRVRDVLAEDFVLGRLYHQNGRKLVLSTTTVHNVNRRSSVQRFAARHSRWLKMRAVINRPSFVADLLLNPSFFALLTATASGWSPIGTRIAVGIVLLKVAGDAFLMQLTRGWSLPWRYWLASPAKDLLMVGVWLHAAFSRTVVWRGVRYNFGAQSRLVRKQRVTSLQVPRRTWARSRSSA